MDQYKQSAHTRYLCNYHLIFRPKYRFRVLRGEIRNKVRDWIWNISKWKGAEIIERHVSTDHVHLVLSILLKYSVSEVMDDQG